ncbi:EF-hand domain-containing protein [Streptomyces sp. SID3343]|uniref:EF-hand domain-containing protein n=1 Tax=Streptomyces sp. SID3343 TaxID=2690260 RepID=UPI00136BB031|nr:EF-hand domain-containing protein [Streptomyces sp. SID3343]MYW01146.1 EF-hand domain-containing protein [Streptomyces sp. SID3343]
MTTAIADPITVKLNALFSVTDTDTDGYVDWADYQRIVDRYLTAYKIDRNDRRARSLTTAHQMYWMELLRHANGPDQLNREQYQHANRAASVDTSRFNMVEGLAHAIFDVMDTDDDNTISRSEFKRFLDVWGIDAPDAMDTFARLDTDGDGVISRHEYIRAIREFFYSPDLDAPGSLFFGRLGR